jgi:soluble cytochrome b562
MSRPSKEINLSELSQTGSQLQKLSESTPASSASSLNLSQLEQQEDFRKLSLDAEQYIGKKAVTQIEEDPEVRDYRTRFLRLKQRLFQPEIDEMTHEIERRFTEKQDAFFKSI